MFEVIVLLDVCGQTHHLVILKITHFHRHRINVNRHDKCRLSMILIIAGMLFGQAGMTCAIDGKE
jgi:hypothetical protein